MPDIEVVIPSDISPSLGETYNLTCNVNGADNLNAVITYNWTKDNGTKTLLKTNTTNYNFPTFRLSDAGNYTCEVNVNSTYLDDIINEHSHTQLEIESKCFFTMSKQYLIRAAFLTVPDPVSVTVETIGVEFEGLPLFLPEGVITNVTLSCSVEVDPTVDIPVAISMKWNGPENFARTLTTTINNTCTIEVTINDLNIKKAGEYNCTATIRARSNNLFITENGTRSNSTSLALCK